MTVGSRETGRQIHSRPPGYILFDFRPCSWLATPGASFRTCVLLSSLGQHCDRSGAIRAWHKVIRNADHDKAIRRALHMPKPPLSTKGKVWRSGRDAAAGAATQATRRPVQLAALLKVR